MLTVNYFSGSDLIGLIESLKLRDPADSCELIVTNNSIEEPLDVADSASLPIRIIPSPNIGFGAGINRAYDDSAGDILFITNPDVRVRPDTIRKAVSFLEEHPDVGIVLPMLRYPDGEFQPSVRRFYSWPVVLYARSPLRSIGEPPRFFREYLYEGIDLTHPSDVDWGLGGAMFLRRSDMEGEGIFDERFFLYFEDVDLCHKFWQRGKRVVYCPQIECQHDHRRSSKQPVSKAGWYHFQSMMRFIAKHRGLPKRPRKISTGAS
ncbi:MAG: glycosyltransferase family 2 protein [Planctomycetes bacterium]|nr:glycosyltransferase family 2 protein [Planctomycetota bacterium]